VTIYKGLTSFVTVQADYLVFVMQMKTSNNSPKMILGDYNSRKPKKNTVKLKYTYSFYINQRFHATVP